MANLVASSLYFFREVSRTAGVSTTDLVGRMLLLTKNHFKQGDKEYEVEKDGKYSSPHYSRILVCLCCFAALRCSLRAFCCVFVCVCIALNFNLPQVALSKRSYEGWTVVF